VSTTTTILAIDDDGMIDGQRSAAIHELCEREGWELKDANEEDWTCVTKRNALNDRQTARKKCVFFIAIVQLFLNVLFGQDNAKE